MRSERTWGGGSQAGERESTAGKDGMPFHLKRQPIVIIRGGVVGGNASNDRECAKLRIGSRPNTSIQFLEASGRQEAAKCFL